MFERVFPKMWVRFDITLFSSGLAGLVFEGKGLVLTKGGADKIVEGPDPLDSFPGYAIAVFPPITLLT